MKSRWLPVVVLVLVLLALAGCGSSGSGSGYDLGTLDLGPGMVFHPDKLEGPAGHFKLRLVNKDSQLHDFALEGTGIVKQVLAGQSATVEFDLKPGTYAMMCTQPGHKDSGMKGTIVVR